MHQFESLEQIEDLILKLEDEMIEEAKEEHLSRINDIRSMSRTVVKKIRPLLYIQDRILKENIRLDVTYGETERMSYTIINDDEMKTSCIF